jgi:hypothetical protein
MLECTLPPQKNKKPLSLNAKIPTPFQERPIDVVAKGRTIQITWSPSKLEFAHLDFFIKAGEMAIDMATSS